MFKISSNKNLPPGEQLSARFSPAEGGADSKNLKVKELLIENVE
jgi:hypothetical protein